MAHRAVSQVGIFYSAIWIPLIFAFFIKALQTGKLVWSMASGMCIGVSILGGHIQPPLYAVVGLSFYAVYRAIIGFHERESYRSVLWPLFCLGVCGLIGFSLAAIQILPSLEYARLALRWVGSPDPIETSVKIPYWIVSSRDYFHPQDLFAFLIPSLLSSRDGNPYMGILPLMFAMLAVAGRKDIHVRFFFALAAISLLYSMGTFSIIHGLAYAFIPMIDKIREPIRGLYLVHFCLAVLVGYGVEIVSKPMKRADKQVLVGLTKYSTYFLGVVSAIIFYVYLRFKLSGEVIKGEPNLEELSFFLLILACSVAFLKGRGYAITRPLMSKAIIVFFVVLDLFSYYGKESFLLKRNFDQKSNFSPEQYYKRCEAIKFLQAQAGFFRIENRGNALPPNFGDVFHLHGILGYSATMLKDYYEFVFMKPTSRVYDLLNVRYIVSKESIEEAKLVHDGEIKVYERSTYFPRAWVVCGIEVIKRPSVLAQRLMSEDFDPQQAVILMESPPNFVSMLTGRKEGESACEITKHSPNEIVLNVETTADGFLVLSEIYYPGWKAYIDGRESKIYKANYIFRALYLTRGSHTVIFKYEPASFQTGLCLSLLTLLSMVAVTAGGIWVKLRAK